MGNAAENSDRTIWRRNEDDPFSPRIFVTANGAIGIEVGGLVQIQTVEGWFESPFVTARSGGPAFPSPTNNQWQHGQVSVRDWFAGQAIAGHADYQSHHPNIVDDAYRIADEMMEKRRKLDPPQKDRASV